MDYKIAKKLKEAGFPQPIIDESSEDDFLFDDGYCHSHYELQIGKNNPVFNPSLSQLIEACEEYFAGLDKTLKTLNSLGLCIWIAKPVDEKKYKKRIGNTPEEAVAGLWLEIYDRPPKN